jgi:cytochrome c553
MKRGEIFARDGYRCVFCGQVFPEEELTVDHLQARSRGGDRSGGNLVTACGGCNARKGRQRLARYLAENPDAYVNFHLYAIHVWKRHLAAIEEEVRKLRRDSSGSDPGLRVRDDGKPLRRQDDLP